MRFYKGQDRVRKGFIPCMVASIGTHANAIIVHLVQINHNEPMRQMLQIDRSLGLG